MSSYARRSHGNVHGHTSPTNHITRHMTRYVKKCNKYESIAKIEYKSAWGGGVFPQAVHTFVYGDINRESSRFQRCCQVCFQRHLRDELHVPGHWVINRACVEYVLSTYSGGSGPTLELGPAPIVMVSKPGDGIMPVSFSFSASSAHPSVITDCATRSPTCRVSSRLPISFSFVLFLGP